MMYLMGNLIILTMRVCVGGGKINMRGHLCFLFLDLTFMEYRHTQILSHINEVNMGGTLE